MYIEDSVLKQITFGYARAEHTEKGWCFHRYTQKQYDVFSEYYHYYTEPFFDGYFQRNCDTDTGISTDFHTDSGTVTFHIADVVVPNEDAKATPRPFTILVNGKRCITSDKPGVYMLQIRKNSRVTLCYPDYGRIYLGGIEVDDGATVTPHTFSKRWLALGDSITHGCGSEPICNYTVKTALRYNIELMNWGNSGYVHNFRTIDAETPFKPDIITSAYGINDFFRKPREDNLADTQAYYTALRAAFPNTKIYCISPIWTALLTGKENAEKREFLYSIYDKIAAEHDITLIDGSKLVPHDRKYFREDGVHPLDNGFHYYASRLGKILFEDENNQ